MNTARRFLPPDTVAMTLYQASAQGTFTFSISDLSEPGAERIKFCEALNSVLLYGGNIMFQNRSGKFTNAVTEDEFKAIVITSMVDVYEQCTRFMIAMVRT